MPFFKWTFQVEHIVTLKDSSRFCFSSLNRSWFASTLCLGIPFTLFRCVVVVFFFFFFFFSFAPFSDGHIASRSGDKTKWTIEWGSMAASAVARPTRFIWNFVQFCSNNFWCFFFQLNFLWFPLDLNISAFLRIFICQRMLFSIAHNVVVVAVVVAVVFTVFPAARAHLLGHAPHVTLSCTMRRTTEIFGEQSSSKSCRCLSTREIVDGFFSVVVSWIPNEYYAWVRNTSLFADLNSTINNINSCLIRRFYAICEICFFFLRCRFLLFFFFPTVKRFIL